MKYIVRIEDAKLGKTKIDAEDIEQAEERARRWVLEGDWSRSGQIGCLSLARNAQRALVPAATLTAQVCRRQPARRCGVPQLRIRDIQVLNIHETDDAVAYGSS